MDLGILERTDRIWGSDCNDALERQTIQRWTGVVVPPELVGAHIGPTTSHTTARTHDLSFRAITALFGHFGMEWDVREVQGEEREELKRFIALYKEHRGLIHSGRMVRADVPDDSLMLHGVVAGSVLQLPPPRATTAALFALVSTRTSFAEQPGRVTLPGLEADAQLPGGGHLPGPGRCRLRPHLHPDPAAGMAGFRGGSQRPVPGRGGAPDAGPQPGTRTAAEGHGALNWPIIRPALPASGPGSAGRRGP